MNSAYAVRPRTASATAHDHQLVAAMLAGDAAAWRAFVRRFEPKVRKNLAKALERLTDDAVASDAVDDVVGNYNLRLVESDMRPLRAWLDFASHVPLAAWLWMIAEALAKNYVRDEARARGEEIDDEIVDEAARTRSWETSDAQVAAPKLEIVDDEAKLTCAWFGDREVLVYDAEGREVFNLPVGTEAKRLKRRDVARSIRRFLARIKRSKAKCA